jgi:hypothetical protein
MDIKKQAVLEYLPLQLPHQLLQLLLLQQLSFRLPFFQRTFNYPNTPCLKFLVDLNMKKSRSRFLDIVIDKLTNSIENTATGEVFDTEIVLLTSKDLKQIKKSDWLFDWGKEIKDKTKQVYKLTTVNNPTIIQGLLSIQDKQDHIFMHLIESAKFNKNKAKIYLGVPGNLVAYACKVSVDKGYQGFLAFDAKSTLIKHYQETLYATHFRGLRMFIETNAALRLISQYFKS